jgi:hypothetical protein
MTKQETEQILHIIDLCIKNQELKYELYADGLYIKHDGRNIITFHFDKWVITVKTKGIESIGLKYSKFGKVARKIRKLLDHIERIESDRAQTIIKDIISAMEYRGI